MDLSRQGMRRRDTSGRKTVKFCSTMWIVTKKKRCFTFNVEYPVSQCPTNFNQSCLFWHIEKILLCWLIGNGLDFSNELRGVYVISYIGPQYLQNPKRKWSAMVTLHWNTAANWGQHWLIQTCLTIFVFTTVTCNSGMRSILWLT